MNELSIIINSKNVTFVSKQTHAFSLSLKIGANCSVYSFNDQHCIYKSRDEKLLFHNLNSFKLIYIQKMAFGKKLITLIHYSSNYDIICSGLIYDMKNLLSPPSKLLIL